MHAVHPSMALAVVLLLAASGCERQTDAERRADVSRDEPPGTIDIGIPRRTADSAPLLE